MAHTARFETDEDTVTMIARVVSNASTADLFVEAPVEDTAFHTHVAARGWHHSPEYHTNVDDITEGTYLTLVYRRVPEYINDDYFYLAETRQSTLTMPSDYETLGHSDMPKVCPECGEEAKAILSEKDFDTGLGRAIVPDHDDTCEIPDDRARWFDMKKGRVYIH